MQLQQPPLISIITVTYNSVSTLGDAINSVLNQTYKNIEYIIIDGASTDGTVELIKSFGKQISCLVSEPDNGIYNAMNKGIAMAKGEYIGFLHADDILAETETIESIANCIVSFSPHVIYGNLEYVAKDNMEKIIRFWQSSPFKASHLKKGWMPPHPTLYVKNTCYQTIGCFNENFSIAADYDFILRLFSQPYITTHYLNKVIVKMRVGGASNKSLKNIITKMKEDYRALHNNGVGGLYSLAFKNLSKVGQFFH